MHSKEKTKKQAPSPIMRRDRIEMKNKIILLILIAVIVVILIPKTKIFFEDYKKKLADIHKFKTKYSGSHSVDHYLKAMNTNDKKIVLNKFIEVTGYLFVNDNRLFLTSTEYKNELDKLSSPQFEPFFKPSHFLPLLLDKSYFKNEKKYNLYRNDEKFKAQYLQDLINKYKDKEVLLRGSLGYIKMAYFRVSSIENAEEK